MIGGRNGSAPVDDGATTIVSVTLGTQVLHRAAGAADTEHTAGVAALGAGGSLILSLASSMDVETPLALFVCITVVPVHFGLNHSFVCGEGHGAAIDISDNAGFSANNQSVISGTIGIPHSMGSQNVVFILL